MLFCTKETWEICDCEYFTQLENPLKPVSWRQGESFTLLQTSLTELNNCKLFSHRGHCHFCGGTQRISLPSALCHVLGLPRIVECPASLVIFHICRQLCCLRALDKCIGVSVYLCVCLCVCQYIWHRQNASVSKKLQDIYSIAFQQWHSTEADISMEQSCFVWSFESKMLTWTGKGRALSEHSWSSWE